jgi:hypothetical protein
VAKFLVGNREFIFAPSSHVRYGEVATGLTLQMMKGVTWTGNIYFDRNTSTEFGISPASVTVIEDAMATLVHGFKGALAPVPRNPLGLVTAGVDFAIGRIGGKFEDRVLVAAQDLNLSSHGAEYLRSFLDHIRLERHLSEDCPLYGATRVVRPALSSSAEQLDQIAQQMSSLDLHLKTIASVPGRWGMIACNAATPTESATGLLEFESRLRNDGHLS